MTGWDHLYEPVGCHPFTGRVTELLLGPLQVAVEQIDHPMRYSGGTRRDHIVFSSILPTDGSTVCSGRPLHANTVVKFPRNHTHTAYANGPIKFVTVAVDEDTLAEFVERSSNGAISRRDVSRNLCLVDDETVGRFQEFLLTTLQQVETQRSLPDQASWRADTKLTLLQLLFDLIDVAVDAPQQLPPASTRAYIVDKAIEHMQGHLTDPVLMESVAAVVRVTSRTLRYSFEEMLGVSPRNYLASLRLRRIRQELCAGGNAQSIQRIAHEYGFWHLGRFAQYYREAFGELPSDTCRRVASGN
jgi:AraC family ethanolamine operon transcriptional activator